MFQNLSDNDKQKSFAFFADMWLFFFFQNDDFAERLIFTDEATFHVIGKAHK